MKRFALKDENGISYISGFPQTHGLTATEKLWELEQAEQDGRLIILPKGGVTANQNLNGWLIATVDYGNELARIEVVTLVRAEYLPIYLAEQGQVELSATNEKEAHHEL